MVDKTLSQKIQIDKSNPALLKQLVMQGMTKQVFSFHPFTLSESLCSFTSEVDGLKPKRVSKQKQQDLLGRVIEDPFYAPYICCIAGKPNDMRAKLLAASVMLKAVSIQASLGNASSKQKKMLKGKGLPLWHTLLGGFDNPVLNPRQNKDTVDSPSLLILSNITMEATASKIEKLRDILETHSNIPRIVVVAGEDPLTFFNTKLHMSLSSCAFLTSNQVKKAVEL